MWFRYEWSVSEWSNCSKPCDRGKQNRTVECKGVLGKMLVNSSLCTADKPEIEQICNDDSCPATWVTGNWSEVGDYVCYIVNNYERCCLRCSVSDNFFFGKLRCIENCPRGYVFWGLNRLTDSSTKWFDFFFRSKVFTNVWKQLPVSLSRVPRYTGGLVFELSKGNKRRHY